MLVFTLWHRSQRTELLCHSIETSVQVHVVCVKKQVMVILYLFISSHLLGCTGAGQASEQSSSRQLQSPEVYMHVCPQTYNSFFWRSQKSYFITVPFSYRFNSIPPCHAFLYRFLDEVQSHANKNKMSVQNLATVFGPNILRPKMEDPVVIMEGMNKLSFILYHTDINRHCINHLRLSWYFFIQMAGKYDAEKIRYISLWKVEYRNTLLLHAIYSWLIHSMSSSQNIYESKVEQHCTVWILIPFYCFL